MVNSAGLNDRDMAGLWPLWEILNTVLLRLVKHPAALLTANW